MAVLKAPLFSFGALGKLADTLVYMRWKGLNTVRKFVIPTNPKSPAQTTQRITNFKAGVTKWHTFTLSALDLAAWSLLASIQISKVHLSYVGVMSNFNCFMRYFVDGIVADAAAVWNEIAHVRTETIAATSLTIRVDECTDADTLKAYYGTSKTYMPNELAAAVGHADDDNRFNLEDLTPSTKYYFYIKATAANCDARTGIYTVTTIAA